MLEVSGNLLTPRLHYIRRTSKTKITQVYLRKQNSQAVDRDKSPNKIIDTQGN